MAFSSFPLVKADAILPHGSISLVDSGVSIPKNLTLKSVFNVLEFGSINRAVSPSTLLTKITSPIPSSMAYNI